MQMCVAARSVETFLSAIALPRLCQHLAALVSVVTASIIPQFCLKHWQSCQRNVNPQYGSSHATPHVYVVALIQVYVLAWFGNINSGWLSVIPLCVDREVRVWP